MRVIGSAVYVVTHSVLFPVPSVSAKKEPKKTEKSSRTVTKTTPAKKKEAPVKKEVCVHTYVYTYVRTVEPLNGGNLHIQDSVL